MERPRANRDVRVDAGNDVAVRRGGWWGGTVHLMPQPRVRRYSRWPAASAPPRRTFSTRRVRPVHPATPRPTGAGEQLGGGRSRAGPCEGSPALPPFVDASRPSPYVVTFSIPPRGGD